MSAGTRHAASLSACQHVAADIYLGVLGATAPRKEHEFPTRSPGREAPREESRVHVSQERTLNSIARCGLSPGWAERAAVDLQFRAPPQVGTGPPVARRFNNAPDTRVKHGPPDGATGGPEELTGPTAGSTAPSDMVTVSNNGPIHR